MTGSASDRARRAAAAGVALSLIAAASAAAAQAGREIGAPVPLIQPPPQRAGPTAPAGTRHPATSAGPAAPEVPALLPQAKESDPASIKVESLDAPDRSGVGLLSEAEAGLGEGIWSGTSARLVAALLPALPMAVPSPVQQDLARRLLLTTAAPPARAPGAEAADLFAIRLERLFAGGRLEDVVALAERGALRPDSAAEPAVRALVQAQLLLGEEAAACSIADARLASSQDPFWQKLQTYCLARQGARSRVEFNVDLLREVGVDDPGFFQLLPAVMGGKPALKAKLAPTPLNMTMLRQAGAPLPPALQDEPTPPIWRAIAAMPRVGDAERLAAAERAAQVGCLPPEELARLYRGIAFSAEQHGNAEGIARERPGPLGNALLFQAIHAEAAPEARAELARLALALAEAQGLYLTLARVYAPVLRELRPTAALSGYALDVGRALVAAGDVEGALAWFRTAHIAAGNRDPQAVGAVVGLWPLLALADDSGQVGDTAETLDTWWQVREEGADPDRFSRATALLTALAAAGRPVEETALWRELLARAPEAEEAEVASPLVLTALAHASEAARTGETVMLALLALGEAGPGRANLSTVADVARALKRVGLVDESKRILLEALFARGF